MRHQFRLSFVLTALLSFATSSQAYQLLVNFSSLPSTQGWQYSSSGALESAVFSIAPGQILSQNTLGLGPSHGANYQILNQLVSGPDITLSFTARILAEEGLPIDYGAISAGVGLNNLGYAVALRPGEIRDLDNNLLSSSIDTSVFHDYVMSIQLGVGYSLSVDGVLVGTSTPTTGAVPNYIYFGDGSNLNARGEYSAFALSQVPEPNTLLLAALALTAFVALRGHRKSVS